MNIIVTSMQKAAENPKLRLFAVIVLAYAFTGSIFDFFEKKDSAANEARARDITEKSLAKLAENTNQRTPIKIDEDTTLTSVLATENKITYFYSLNYDKSEVDMEFFKQNTQKLIVTNLCEKPSNRNLLDVGVLVGYSYVDKNGQFIADFTVHKSECESLPTPAEVSELSELDQAFIKAIKNLK